MSLALKILEQWFSFPSYFAVPIEFYPSVVSYFAVHIEFAQQNLSIFFSHVQSSHKYYSIPKVETEQFNKIRKTVAAPGRSLLPRAAGRKLSSGARSPHSDTMFNNIRREEYCKYWTLNSVYEGYIYRVEKTRKGIYI